MNRIREFLDPPEEEQPFGDFVVVSGSFGFALVSHAEALDIERQLDRRRKPAWIVFRDRSGSRVRVRATEIRVLYESTADQRAFDRRMERARRREERADQPPSWEEEE